MRDPDHKDEESAGRSRTLLALGFVLLDLAEAVQVHPDYPNNLWPYLVLAWLPAAWALMRVRPALARAPLAAIDQL